MMRDRIESLIKEVEDFSTITKEHAEEFRLKYLSRKGKISELFDEFKTVSPELKKEVGQLLNRLKVTAQEKLDSSKEEENSSASTGEDLTRPVAGWKGSRHPISIVRKNILDIFGRLGFTVEEGPEIEDDWHNFTAL